MASQYLIQKVTADGRTIDLAQVNETDLNSTRQSYRAEITKGSSEYLQVIEV